MWVIAVAILMWILAGSSGLGSSVHAAPQAGVDPTGSNFAIWGSPRFNRRIGPDEVVVQVAGGCDFIVSLPSDGLVACRGSNEDRRCDVPSGIGTPENPVASVAANGGYTVAVLEAPTNPPCPADLDGDGEVRGSDFGRLFIGWGDCSDCAADLDGVVGGSDLGLMSIAWGDCPG